MLSYSNIKIFFKKYLHCSNLKSDQTAWNYQQLPASSQTKLCSLPGWFWIRFTLIHIYHGLGSYHPTTWEGLFIKLLLDNHLSATSQRFTWTCLKREIYGRLQRKPEESPNLWWLGFGFRGNFPMFLEKPNQPTNTIILWDSKILLHKNSPASSECIHCTIMAERGQKVAFLL